jgi:hypothetical protein
MSASFNKLPGDDMRREDRAQAVYLPCCVRVAERCGVGLIRNISASGLMIETDIAAEPGEEIEYFQDSTQWCRARVAWRDGRRIGLSAIEEAGSDLAASFPPRSIRIPTTLIGRLWLNGHASEVGIGNISLKGVLAFGMPAIETSQLFTLTIAGRDFPNTAMRWWAEGSAGLRFGQPITLRVLTDLIDKAGSAGSGFYYERRIGSLLEVVPANDERLGGRAKL